MEGEMPFTIRKDVVYALLRKINDSDEGKLEINFNEPDLKALDLDEGEFIRQLDYLNQNQYILGEKGNFEAEPGIFPEGAQEPVPVKFKTAQITHKGQNLLKKIEIDLSKIDSDKSRAIGSKDMPFLEKVMLKGGLEDIFDARDISEVVFRVMRDLMTTEAADHVESELHKEALPSEDKSLQMEIADLWHDTNPIVRYLSRVRPPWDGPGIFKIDGDRFLFRVANESGFSHNVDREQVISAVFSATKDELSQERIAEIAGWMPDYIRKLWDEA
jgi:uncharacterized protein (DUF2267 family)